LAHRIGLKVVAEGVESQVEADWLLSLKCDELQGYFVSWPLPGPLVIPYMTSHASAASGRARPRECEVEFASVA